MVEKMIPDIIVGRLPKYLRAVTQMQSAGKVTTSSQEIGDYLGISAAQIRKDLSQFGEFGKQGTGYSIDYLIDQLEGILRVDRAWKMALVGMGDLGHAIARYQGFPESGFEIALLYDNDPKKIGVKVGNLIVRDIHNLVSEVKQAGIRVAMITTPTSSAQQVADCLVQAGVQAILNYSPASLVVPDGVRVQNIDPVVHLQRMTYYLE